MQETRGHVASISLGHAGAASSWGQQWGLLGDWDAVFWIYCSSWSRGEGAPATCGSVLSLPRCAAHMGCTVGAQLGMGSAALIFFLKEKLILFLPKYLSL